MFHSNQDNTYAQEENILAISDDGRWIVARSKGASSCAKDNVSLVFSTVLFWASADTFGWVVSTDDMCLLGSQYIT